MESYERAKASREALKLEVFNAYGGPKCACPGCGETTYKFLQMDHINNDGGEHRKTDKTASSLYLWLKRHGFPRGFQVLCANCNFGKRMNGGVCPHEGDWAHASQVPHTYRLYSCIGCHEIVKGSDLYSIDDDPYFLCKTCGKDKVPQPGPGTEMYRLWAIPPVFSHDSN